MRVFGLCKWVLKIDVGVCGVLGNEKGFGSPLLSLVLGQHDRLLVNAHDDRIRNLTKTVNSDEAEYGT